MKKNQLPKGSDDIIRALEEKGALTQIELISVIKEKNPRAIRYTVKTLLEKDFLIRHPNFDDMRSSLIHINKRNEGLQIKDTRSKKN
ncbi:MAG: hypothetical protein HGN29_08410 [Asgard group archaeon]|nr:hypothetical protein [Asgard group archaeon]